ncbi:MAG: GNAT family N-acetyltransferase [Gammaproteobacteria bacterium]|nr:GNAT family N-acetyltransferase [Gammaproteobacteria bacterium]
MEIEILDADYLNETHAQEIALLMNSYAADPMGGGNPLAEKVKNNIAKELSKRPYAFSVMSYINGVAAGLVNCFELFSTFSCKPLVNIHDIIVLEKYRGRGLSQKMLDRVENIAISRGCCKLTLEVLEENRIARSLYSKFGFSDYELDPKMGRALFWQKVLKNTHINTL